MANPRGEQVRAKLGPLPSPHSRLVSGHVRSQFQSSLPAKEPAVVDIPRKTKGLTGIVLTLLQVTRQDIGGGGGGVRGSFFFFLSVWKHEGFRCFLSLIHLTAEELRCFFNSHSLLKRWRTLMGLFVRLFVLGGGRGAHAWED